MSQEDKVRAFFGVPVGGELTTDLETIVFKVNPELNALLRWTRPGNHHVTLRFLGNIAIKSIDTFAQIAAQSTANVQPFSLKIYKIARFPNVRGKIIAAHIQSTAELNELYSPVEQACLDLGLVPEGHGYRPHITLARAKGMGEFEFTPVLDLAMVLPVRELILYQSVSTEKGARYEPLFKFAL